MENGGLIISSFSHIEGVKIDNNVSIGPYARIRPGAIIKSGAKIGMKCSICLKLVMARNSKPLTLNTVSAKNAKIFSALAPLISPMAEAVR